MIGSCIANVATTESQKTNCNRINAINWRKIKIKTPASDQRQRSKNRILTRQIHEMKEEKIQKRKFNYQDQFA